MATLILHDAPCEDEDLLAIATDLATGLDAEEREDLDPGDVEEQGILVELDRFPSWRAQLAIECAEACGCIVYADDEGEGETPIAIVLVGRLEDAEAARVVFRRMERSVLRSLRKHCHGRPHFADEWAATFIVGAAHKIDAIADAALERAYAYVDPTTQQRITWPEQGDPFDRAVAAREWLERQPDAPEIREVMVVPTPAPEGTVSLAAFAARREVGS